MNKILEEIIKSRKGHYCHCLEVEEVYELECIAESITEEFQDKHSKNEIIEFLETLGVYCLNDDNEDDIYNFSFSEYVKDTI